MKNQNNDKTSNSIYTFNLSKNYQNYTAVDSVNISVDPGDIYGFLGPNGAGKTTTIRMLCGLIAPSSGTGKIAGFDIVKETSKIRKIIGLLPESSGFYNWMSAEEYLLYFSKLYNIDQENAKKRAKDLLGKVSLVSKSSIPIGYYSRGMKQRLALARTLINEPKVLFLDEPTLGLDPKGQQDIKKILLDINHQNNVTIFFSSHALNEVSYLCNKIAIVNKGRLVAEGTIDELRKLTGSSLEYLTIRILNKYNSMSNISNFPLRFETKPKIMENNIIEFSILEDESQSIRKVIDIIHKANLQIYEIQRSNPSLDEIFFKLTSSKKQEQYDKKINDEMLGGNDIEKNKDINYNTNNFKLLNKKNEE